MRSKLGHIPLHSMVTVGVQLRVAFYSAVKNGVPSGQSCRYRMHFGISVLPAVLF